MVLAFLIACCVIIISLFGIVDLFDECMAQAERELVLDELWDDDDLADSA